MIFLTTTAIEIDEELLNRCLVLTVDEDREQTRAIHRLQRRAADARGAARAAGAARRCSRCTRTRSGCLRPLLVANPYARAADLPRRPDADAARPREVPDADPRDRAPAPVPAAGARRVEHRGRGGAVHRGRRSRTSRWRTAWRTRCSGRSLDELPPQTRRLLELLDEMVRAGVRSGRAMDAQRLPLHAGARCASTRAGATTQVRVHLERLVELEYVLVHRGGRGQSFVYELLYDGAGQGRAAPFSSGSLDVEALRAACGYDRETWRGSEGDLAGGWRGQDGPKTGAWSGWRNRRARPSPSSETARRRAART